MTIEIDTIYVHDRTGGEYMVVALPKLQINDPSYDMIEMVVYQHRVSGALWVRPLHEFITKFSEKE